MYAMPLMLGVLCLMAIAYRYYSAFLAAKVATLNNLRQTPAIRLNDGQNYHPTSKWVLFGHHFAAISGAGPLIGPVLAAQFGYMPGLLWIVIGVCLAGAVQDFLVLVASMRRNGKSLGQIAFDEIGRFPGTVAIVAILFIVIVALAGLGAVVKKSLGGEMATFPANASLVITAPMADPLQKDGQFAYTIPPHSRLEQAGQPPLDIDESFTLLSKAPLPVTPSAVPAVASPAPALSAAPPAVATLALGSAPADPRHAAAVRAVPGSVWGVFTIACTIPIALFVGLYMYKIRKGNVVEASIIGGVLTLGATVAGGWVATQSWSGVFNLSGNSIVIAMAVYGFVASVLPVWFLLCPRDYLSSFLKIGTIALLVIGTLLANPKMQAPAYNQLFASGGPVVTGRIFPFLFITIMCGAISGFHALVSSGTTPKMIRKETDARVIGYGAMLIEGLVGVVAMIAASALPVRNYYAMNVDLADAPALQSKLAQLDPHNLNPDTLAQDEARTSETLRGRTGGAVTLAVGMARIFDDAAKKISVSAENVVSSLYRYWYHFAIMFEALFILTTIDTGTRISRFLLQEVAGKLHPKLGRPNWLPGALVSTFLVVVAWAWFINSSNFPTIWKMFGIANQTLAVIALAVVCAVLVSERRMKFLWVTFVPMLVVLTTTGSAAVEMILGNWETLSAQMARAPEARNMTLVYDALVRGLLTLFMLFSAGVVIIAALIKIWRSTGGLRHEAPGSAAGPPGIPIAVPEPAMRSLGPQPGQ